VIVREKTSFSRRNLLKALAATSAVPVLSRCGKPPELAEVLILGAGISGLYAAWLLQQQGIDALVVEASDRIGGRLLTLDHLKGKPEAGGQSLDAMYARTLALAAELGVGTYPRKSFAPGFALHVNGELIASDKWADAGANRLQGEERAVLPHQLADFYLDRVSPLANLDDWLDPRFGDLDSRSLADELGRAGASPEALRLIEILYDGRGIDNVSALFACRKRLVAKMGGGRFFRIRGGSARLPEAITARLRREVHTRRAVREINLDAQGVECLCADGRRYRGRFALVSIPFSVLRRIVVRPQPPPEQWKIIDSLPYNRITQVKLAFRSRFWEQDGLPPAMITDQVFEKVFAVPAEDGELHELNCWIDGQRAAKLDDKESDPLGRMVIKEIAAARPAAAGQLEVLDVTSWGRNAYSLGAYHFWGPGQFSRFGAVARQPWGPVHWIGEHMAVLQQGIEGAMESAEREVLALLQRMGGAAAA
jgi:monoamine oxidase